MIVWFVIVLMTRRLSALTALVLVPLVFGLLAGFGTGLGGMVVDAMSTVAPTGVMLIFAMLYFMVMTDAGMFDPLAKAIVKSRGRRSGQSLSRDRRARAFSWRWTATARPST